MKPDHDSFKLATAIIGLLMAFIAVLPSLVSHTAREANTRLETSMRNVQLYEDLLVLLLDAETAQRGFLITGNKELLVSYQSAVSRYPEIRAQLKESARDTRNTVGMLHLADTRLKYLAETIKVRREKGFEYSAALVGAGPGQYSMESLRSLIDERKRKAADQQTWLQGRVAGELEQAANVAITATAVNLILLASLLYMTFRALNDRQTAMAVPEPELNARYGNNEASEFESADVNDELDPPTIPMGEVARNKRFQEAVVVSVPEVTEASSLAHA